MCKQRRDCPRESRGASAPFSPMHPSGQSGAEHAASAVRRQSIGCAATCDRAKPTVAAEINSRIVVVLADLGEEDLQNPTTRTSLPPTLDKHAELDHKVKGWPYFNLNSFSRSLGKGLAHNLGGYGPLCMLEPLCHPLQRVTGVANRLRRATMYVDWSYDTCHP